ncbi:hypothetical protein BX600DRAFT_504952 [Xylariales sp. PMI_506]|nr:hypothetical protein BX600DRAFT_504952 [Xylariales sp. PMI_506]
MATRYPTELLLHLRDSPLCVKPSALPPAEEWMGPPPETFRTSQGQNNGKVGPDRARNGDSTLLDQTNRRPGVDRHAPRNGANPEDIILGPPRTMFSSSTLSRGSRPFDNDKTFKESDSRERFATFRRNGEGDGERFPRGDRDRPDRDREGRTNLRRRGDADQDSDGWSTVKPRKSFGHEGAERFHGRMGDRFGGDRRVRENQEDSADRPRRSNLAEFSRDKEGEEGDRPRRNGLNRNRTEQPSWGRANNSDNDPAPARERFDRAKSWRDRDRDEQLGDDKPRDRGGDRRWGEHRQEREPEWLDEPMEEKAQGHTAEDFQKFMESMKASKSTGPAKSEQNPASATEGISRDALLETDKFTAKSAPAIELGPDKFFANFASPSSTDSSKPTEQKESAASKPKTGSRFQNFFTTQEDRRQTEPSTPAPSIPIQETNPLLAFAAAASANKGSSASPVNQQDASEKVAFQALLQKLQKQSLSSHTPPSGGYPAPPHVHEAGPKSSVASPGPYPPFIHDGREEPQNRPPPPQDMRAPRPQQPNQLPPMRTEQQMLQDLIGQRHPMPSQMPGRADHSQSRSSNSNAEFLMALMQGGRSNVEPPRTEQVIRMPQPSRPAQIPQTPDRELDYQRERSSSQHQGRPQGLPGFFDEPQLPHHEQDNRRQQPTQILQRQGPPGLEQMHPNWMQGGNQQMPPGPGRPMIPPQDLRATLEMAPCRACSPLTSLWEDSRPKPWQGHLHETWYLLRAFLEDHHLPALFPLRAWAVFFTVGRNRSLSALMVVECHRPVPEASAEIRNYHLTMSKQRRIPHPKHSCSL